MEKPPGIRPQTQSATAAISLTTITSTTGAASMPQNPRSLTHVASEPQPPMVTSVQLPQLGISAVSSLPTMELEPTSTSPTQLVPVLTDLQPQNKTLATHPTEGDNAVSTGNNAPDFKSASKLPGPSEDISDNTEPSDASAQADAAILSTRFQIIDKDAALYVKDVLNYFKFIEGGGRDFDELVELWQKFEMAAGYPNGQVSSQWLPSPFLPFTI